MTANSSFLVKICMFGSANVAWKIEFFYDQNKLKMTHIKQAFAQSLRLGETNVAGKIAIFLMPSLRFSLFLCTAVNCGKIMVLIF